MPNLRFHLITVIGIFLALALGIVIGSTFTEDSIIQEQRSTIDSMRDALEKMGREQAKLLDQTETQSASLNLFQSWLGRMGPLYQEANPIQLKAVLIRAGDFDPSYLGSYINENVIQTQIQLDAFDAQGARLLAQAVIQGDGSALAELPGGVFIEGELQPADYVLLAPGEKGGWTEVKTLAVGLLNAEIPVVAIGLSGWPGLADLVRHPLFASVSHLDTPMAAYCLNAILRGRGGHYGPEALLPDPVEP